MMIAWYWLVPTFFAGFILGVIVMGGLGILAGEVDTKIEAMSKVFPF